MEHTNSFLPEATDMASNLASRITEPFKSLSELYEALEIGLVESYYEIEPSISFIRDSVDYVYQGLDVSKQRDALLMLPRDSSPRTLVCHDMKGGYLEDRFLGGSPSHESYTFYYWNAIDIFVYFSHHFVTIPPFGWINAAHQHGVKVLGTVITEGNDDTWDVILDSQENLRKFADCLALVARCYQFDGWLLNVENKIKPENVSNLLIFIQYLTEKIHNEIDGSQIIWYDSVIKSGELSWQNELNEKNKDFFLACDGIYLNYNWTESKLSNSKKYAHDLKRDCLDVYVGVDVWGRGCPGGGGLNTAYAMNLIRSRNMSAAIFAPGWTHEYFGPSTFRVLEDLFWAQLYPYLYVHVLIYEDEVFETSFCRGAGSCYYLNGVELSNMFEINGETSNETKTFYNMRRQQLQLSVPVPYLRFTRSIKHNDDNRNNIDSSNMNHDEDKSDKDTEERTKKPRKIEHTYENRISIVRLSNNNITFENKLFAPNFNTFEYCDAFSYEGGGCLKLITTDPTLYHRLFLTYYSTKYEIQASIIYSNFDRNSNLCPILILGWRNRKLKSIRPYIFERLNDTWRKCIYLTNLTTIEEIGVSFSTACVCYLGKITMDMKDNGFDNVDPAKIDTLVSDYCTPNTSF